MGIFLTAREETFYRASWLILMTVANKPANSVTKDVKGQSLPVSGGSTLKIKVSGLSASTSIAEASILQKFQCTCHVAFTFTLTSFYKPSWSAYLCFKCSSMFFAPWKPFDKTSHLKNKENKHTENSFRQTSINACLSTNRDSLHASIDPQSFTWLPKWRLQLTATPRKALTEYSCTVAVSLNN